MIARHRLNTEQGKSPVARRVDPGCGGCALFVDDPHALERLFPGIGALSSAFGSTRGPAGVCLDDQRFHDPSRACARFQARNERGDA
jgi:hypothetical protein